MDPTKMILKILKIKRFLTESHKWTTQAPESIRKVVRFDSNLIDMVSSQDQVIKKSICQVLMFDMIDMGIYRYCLGDVEGLIKKCGWRSLEWDSH